jgi:hypothetical protein
MNRTIVIRRLTTLAAIVLAMMALTAPAAWAKTFTVNSTANPGDGVCNATECTLTEAVEGANVNGETDIINFASGLSGEIDVFNTATQGGFSILNDTPAVDLTINGPGAGMLAVNGNNDTRAFGIASGTKATINGLTIKNGKAPESGLTEGGAIINAGTLTLNNSTVSGSTATWGGGIYNDDGTLTLNRSTVSGNNHASINGGGIYNDRGILTLNRSTVSGNTADSRGGGIFSHNDLSDDTTTISNSTISGNTAGTRGGGIYNYIGIVKIKNSTITNNTAPSGEGSGVSSSEGTSTRTEVLSTIISANANNNDVEVDGDTTNSFKSSGYNLIGGGDAIAAFNKSGDQRGIPDPGLGLLINNGGPTQTHAVLKGSRAIDRGPLKGCPATDQRDKPRPQNGDGKGTSRCDIGAFEKKTVR